VGTASLFPLTSIRKKMIDFGVAKSVINMKIGGGKIRSGGSGGSSRQKGRKVKSKGRQLGGRGWRAIWLGSGERWGGIGLKKHYGTKKPIGKKVRWETDCIMKTKGAGILSITIMK